MVVLVGINNGTNSVGSTEKIITDNLYSVNGSTNIMWCIVSYEELSV
jgi:hypothetical protein